jgi:SAM-dependent methyltransferase
MPSSGPETLDQNAAAMQEYFRFHKRRYDVLLAKARASAGRLRGAALEILDIGLSFQTVLLQQAFPESTVHTLGFEDQRFRDGVRGHHYSFDLNRSWDRSLWVEVPPQDMVVMGEVLEHLQAPPQAVFECMASWLRPAGELLLQTPNAVSLPKRLRMLRGYNPFMMPKNPGDISAHVREYTLAELIELGAAAGLEVREAGVFNYFAHAGRTGGLYYRLGAVLPEGLRDGITICYRKR